MFKRFVSIFLSIAIFSALITGSCILVYADSTTSEENKITTVYDDGETVITAYEDAGGNVYFMQYVDGYLVQKNTISADDNMIIEREIYDVSSNEAVVHDTINVNDYGKVQAVQSLPRASSSTTLAGTIHYKALLDTGTIYYGLKCIYETKNIGNTTYTINNFTGRLVELISIIVGALKTPYKIGSDFTTALLNGLGIAVVSGFVSAQVTDTVSCIETDYVWTLTDTTSSSHKKTVNGAKYYITDAKSAAKNKTYYDGYVPKDWKTQSMAVWFHNEMFTYSSWSVVSWS